jgi:hypothetical protein
LQIDYGADSTNFPNVTGGSIRMVRGNTDAVGYFEIWKSTVNDGELYMRVGTGTSTFGPWLRIATKETIPGYIGNDNTTDVVTKAFLNTTYPAASYPIGTVVSYYNQNKIFERVSPQRGH